MPFLVEKEWAYMGPLYPNGSEAIKEYREKHGCDMMTARLNATSPAQTNFQIITGWPHMPSETIAHHRPSHWGKECEKCGHLLRTPKASFCANCGHEPITRS